MAYVRVRTGRYFFRLSGAGFSVLRAYSSAFVTRLFLTAITSEGICTFFTCTKASKRFLLYFTSPSCSTLVTDGHRVNQLVEQSYEHATSLPGRAFTRACPGRFPHLPRSSGCERVALLVSFASVARQPSLSCHHLVHLQADRHASHLHTDHHKADFYSSRHTRLLRIPADQDDRQRYSLYAREAPRQCPREGKVEAGEAECYRARAEEQKEESGRWS